MAKSTASSKEGRITKRVSAPCTLFCYLKIQGNKVVGPLKVQNISQGGATLVLDPSFAKEKVLAVQLYNKARGCWEERDIQIAYLFLARQCYAVGVTFDRPLSEDKLQEFL